MRKARMPTRTRLLLILILACAAFCAAGAILAQDAPSSGYRLRPERGYSQQLHVESDEQPAPARVSASLSDDESAAEEQETRDREQETGDGGTEGKRDGGTNSPSLRHSVTPSPRHSVSPSPPLSHATLVQDKPPLRLAPRSETGGRQLAKPAAASGTGAIGTVAGSLAVVLGLFVVVVWISRRMGPVGSAPLPKEAVELLGRTTVSGQHVLQLVRVGGKLLLVALSPHGAATLTEIIDPAEVERLTAICLRQRPGSASASFASTVSQLERESAGRSFVDQRRPAASPSARARTTSRA